jgi:DNA-3-methyladenine glycosylase
MFVIYGMHWNFNIVTGEAGQPHAVLVRAVEPLLGHATMSRFREVPADSKALTNGPGKLCQAFGLNRAHYAADLCHDALYLAAGEKLKVARSKRIGIDYAGSFAHKPWRFYNPDSQFVSTVPRARARK